MSECYLTASGHPGMTHSSDLLHVQLVRDGQPTELVRTVCDLCAGGWLTGLLGGRDTATVSLIENQGRRYVMTQDEAEHELAQHGLSADWDWHPCPGCGQLTVDLRVGCVSCRWSS